MSIPKVGVICSKADAAARKIGKISRISLDEAYPAVTGVIKDSSAKSKVVSDETMANKVAKFKKVISRVVKKAENVTNIGSLSYKDGVYMKDGKPYTGFARTYHDAFNDNIPIGEYFRNGKLVLSVDAYQEPGFDGIQRVSIRNQKTGNSAAFTRVNSIKESKAIYSSNTDGIQKEIESSAKPVGEIFDRTC